MLTRDEYWQEIHGMRRADCCGNCINIIGKCDGEGRCRIKDNTPLLPDWDYSGLISITDICDLYVRED